VQQFLDRRFRAPSFTFVSVLTVFTIVSCLFFTLSQPLKTKIIACDVGQGDAVLIQHGQKRILIDSGPNSDVLECLPRVPILAFKRLDVAVLTHWDKDHVGGFASVLQNFTIDRFFANAPVKETQVVVDLEKVRENQGGFATPQIGDQIIYPGLRLRFLWNASGPSLVSRSTPEEDENASSVGTLVIGKSFGFLGLGDLECTHELAVHTLPLLSSYQILKVSHHGAKSSSCLEFLQRGRPEVALISSGAGNSYGHPDPQTLENLREIGILPLRTDQYGRLSLTKMEKGWQLEKGSKRE